LLNGLDHPGGNQFGLMAFEPISGILQQLSHSLNLGCRPQLPREPLHHVYQRHQNEEGDQERQQPGSDAGRRNDFLHAAFQRVEQISQHNSQNDIGENRPDQQDGQGEEDHQKEQEVTGAD
jgi:hypothetical protein